MKKEYDFSNGKRGAVIPHQGKTRISIWIDNEILDWFKNESERSGLGYQTAMNQALRNYTLQDHAPVCRKDVVEIVRSMLKTGTDSG